MTETDYKLLQLLWEDPKLGTIIARIVLAALVISIILEKRTRLKPWTRLIQWIGKTANQQIITRMDQLDEKLDNLQKLQEETRKESEERDRKLKEDMEYSNAKGAKRRILRYSDEISYGSPPHSKESFLDALEDCDEYENFYDSHPDIKDGVARAAVKNIQKHYEKKLEENDFFDGKEGNT